MQLAFDLDAQTLVNLDNPAINIGEIVVRRNTSFPLDVGFYLGGERVEVPGATVSAQVNEADTFGGSGLVSDASADMIGEGVEQLARLELDFSGSAIDTAFTGDPGEVSASLEVALTTADGYTFRSKATLTTIQNSIGA